MRCIAVEHDDKGDPVPLQTRRKRFLLRDSFAPRAVHRSVGREKNGGIPLSVFRKTEHKPRRLRLSAFFFGAERAFQRMHERALARPRSAEHRQRKCAARTAAESLVHFVRHIKTASHLPNLFGTEAVFAKSPRPPVTVQYMRRLYEKCLVFLFSSLFCRAKVFSPTYDAPLPPAAQRYFCGARTR